MLQYSYIYIFNYTKIGAYFKTLPISSTFLVPQRGLALWP